MKQTVGTKIAAGFGVIMAIFVAVGAISYRGTSELIDAAEMQSHTYEVLNTRDTAHSAVKDTGVALRSYLISGEPRDAERVQAVIAAMEKPLPVLRLAAAFRQVLRRWCRAPHRAQAPRGVPRARRRERSQPIE